MGATLTTFAEALKTFYLEPLREQLNNMSPTWDQFESTDKMIEGEETVLHIHKSRNSGVGARGERAPLPTPGSQGYERVRVGMKYMYGTLAITGQTIEASKTSRGAAVRGLESEMTGLVKDLRRDMNRQIFNNRFHTLAQCGTTTASTTLQLQTTTPQSFYNFIEVGMKIDIGTTADPDSISITEREVTAIDQANDTITISGTAVTTTSSHYVTRAGAGGNEINGLIHIVDDSTTLHQINPGTAGNEYWKSHVSDNGGTNRAFTDVVVERAMDALDISLGSKDPYFGITTHGGMRALAASLKSQRRYSADGELRGGWKGVPIDCGDATVVFRRDRDCPDETAFLLRTNELQMHVMADWNWMNRDGDILSRTSFDEYEARMFRYHEFCTPVRKAHARIDDLTEDASE